ncbi:MAG: type II secretion system protein [Planctomycetota bacterium]
MSPQRRTSAICHGCSRIGAFTLIELLVVIGIVALLIGLLLPTLSRSVDAARGTVDAANLRSIAAASLGYAHEQDASLPFGLLAYDGNAQATTDLLAVEQVETWADTLARWSDGGDAEAPIPWRAPGVPISATPAYGANPIAMPAPLLFAVRNTNHREAEAAPAKLPRLYPDTALFWTSAAYSSASSPAGPGVSPAGVPATVGFSGVDDGLAFGFYTKRDTPFARYRDRTRPDPVANDPLLRADASIRVFGDEADAPNDRDFGVPLSFVTEPGNWMPARFRYGNRCNVARTDGSVAAFQRGKPDSEGIHDSEFRRWMLKIKFPRR